MGNIRPARVGLLAHRPRGTRGYGQNPGRRHIRERIVGDVVVGLIHRSDVENLVAVTLRDIAHAAGPESRHLPDDRPTIGSEPIAIQRCQIVLPLRNGNIGIDVNLALAKYVGKMRRLFAAILRIRFPRVHGSGITAFMRARLGGTERASAKHHQRLRTLGVQQ